MYRPISSACARAPGTEPDTSQQTERDLLEINAENIRKIIAETRAFDGSEDKIESEKDEFDDTAAETPESPEQDNACEKLREFMRSPDVDEQAPLVALVGIGRGTCEAADSGFAFLEARRTHNSRIGEYFLTIPLLSDYLQEGLYAIEAEGIDASNASGGAVC